MAGTRMWRGWKEGGGWIDDVLKRLQGRGRANGCQGDCTDGRCKLSSIQPSITTNQKISVRNNNMRTHRPLRKLCYNDPFHGIYYTVYAPKNDPIPPRLNFIDNNQMPVSERKQVHTLHFQKIFVLLFSPILARLTFSTCSNAKCAYCYYVQIM